jgi:outer membrane cobalamin receptor
MKTRVLFVAAFAFLAFDTFAQQVQQDTLSIDEIIVTGSKMETSRKIVPISVSQVSRTNIENSGQINILPALNYFVPGIFVTERNILGFGVATGGSGSISIRGIGGSPNTGVLILIDGHPQYQGIFGHPLPDAYVASDVEKVEIIRGPGSILYGSNAMNGVVNILTRKQHDEGLKLNMGAAYGSFNTQKYFGTVGYKKDKFSAFVSLNHDQTDGTREKTDFTITNAYTKIAFEFNKKFSLVVDFSVAKFNANDNGPVYAEPKPFTIDILRGKTSISLENKFKKAEGALKLYHNFGTHDLSDGWYSVDRNSGLMVYQSFRITEKTNLTVGSDLKQYGGKGNSGMSRDTFKTANEFALYAYMQQTMFEKLSFSTGLRLENNSMYGNEWVPMAGLAYNPVKTATIKASVSKGFRSPTIMEMYLFAPNPALRPESLVNYEIGYLQSLWGNTLNVELTVYKANARDMIQVTGQFPNVKRQNIGSFTNKGIEISARYLAGKNLIFSGNYSYLHLEKPMLAAPEKQFNFNVNYTYKNLNLNISTQHIEKLFVRLNPDITEYYTLLNARLTIEPVKFLQVFVAGNNLLDQQYEINYGYPMPGLNYNLGLKLRF